MLGRKFIALAGLALLLSGVVPPGAVAAPTATAESSSSLFTPVTPVRVLDTREGTGTPVGPGATITLDLSSRLPATATAVVLNLTGASPTTATHVTVYPRDLPRPDTMSLTLAAGETRAGLTTTMVSADRKLLLYNNLGSTHLIADLTGYYATDTGSKYRVMSPIRMLDTRSGSGPFGPGTTRTVDLSSKVPESATAVTFTLTGTNPTAWTFITAWPHGTDRPWTSNLNLVTAGQTSPNLVVLPIGANRAVDLYNYAGNTDLIVDLVGYYGADADSVYTPLAPQRRMDTRTGQPVGPGSIAPITMSPLPEGTNAVVFSLTGTSPTAATFVSVHEGQFPATSSLNLAAGQTATNLVVAPVNKGLYNHTGTVHLIGDIAGYFTRTCAGLGTCVYSWGANWGGLLGDGSTGLDRLTAKPVWNTPGITALAGGVDANLALRNNGTVLAWGTSELVPGGGSRIPVVIPSLSGITAIATGDDNALALKSDGTVWSWGDGRYGQIGDGVDYGSGGTSTPVPVSGLTDVVAIASGRHNGYAVRADGTVWAWGSNAYGWLGNGVTCPTPQQYGACSTNVPVQVSGLTGVAAVSEDGYALKSDGTVWTWGVNSAGVLGIGDPAGLRIATVPVQVTALTDIVQIDGSNQNRYALKSDGTVWAWGSNREGQIGIGTTDDPVRSPVQVSQLTGVTSIASGEAYNGYAVKADGSVWAWGYNLNGQLGVISEGLYSAVPLKIPNLAGVSKVSGYFFGALALVSQPR